MTHCYDEGTLRAYVDNELAKTTRNEIAAHLDQCVVCQEQVAILREQAQDIGYMLTDNIAVVDAHTALKKFQERIPHNVGAATPAVPPEVEWRTGMKQTNNGWFARNRKLFVGLAAMVLVVSLLALPPVRALADQFLQVFRVQKVMFVPISSERMEELENLDFDSSTLFVGEPEVINEPAEPIEVGDASEAAGMVGYPIHEPTVFPDGDPITTTVSVRDDTSFQFQVNVDSARQLLALMDINDVTLPDGLGDQPITVNVPSSAALKYEGDNYNVFLYQGQSPDMTLPEGVDLSQLGKAALRLLGMEAHQADVLASQIDWSSTLLFPFPEDLGSIRQVTVNGNQALMTDGAGHHHHQGRFDNHKQLYWQSEGRFYVIIADGSVNSEDMLNVAQSIR